MIELTDEQKENIKFEYYQRLDNICNNEGKKHPNMYDRGYDEGYRDALDFINNTLGLDLI